MSISGEHGDSLKREMSFGVKQGIPIQGRTWASLRVTDTFLGLPKTFKGNLVRIDMEGYSDYMGVNSCTFLKNHFI